MKRLTSASLVVVSVFFAASLAGGQGYGCFPILVRSAAEASGFTDPSKDRQDSVKDLRNAVGRASNVCLVVSEKDALIVLEVLGRETTREVNGWTFMTGHAQNKSHLGVRLTVNDFSTEFSADSGSSGMFTAYAVAAQNVAAQVATWVTTNRQRLQQAMAARRLAGTLPPVAARTAGIVELTDATAEEAAELGQGTPPESLNMPLAMRLETVKWGDADVSQSAEDALAAYKDSPYRVVVMSPFMRAIDLARRARRRHEPAPAPSLPGLNAAQVVVHVTAGLNYQALDPIKSVFIRRGGEIITPLQSSVKMTFVVDDEQKSRQSADGDFTFPFAVFEPSAEIAILLTGERGTCRITVTAGELARMR